MTQLPRIKHCCNALFQYNGQHLFVHIGNNVTYSDPVLEVSAFMHFRQILYHSVQKNA